MGVVDHSAPEDCHGSACFFSPFFGILEKDLARNGKSIRPEPPQQRAEKSGIDNHIIVEENDDVVAGSPHSGVIAFRKPQVFLQG